MIDYGKLPTDCEEFFVDMVSLFDVVIPTPKLVTVTCRSEFDILLGRSTPSPVWMVAGVIGRQIIIFSRDSFSRETTHKEVEFELIVNHEIVHLFTRAKFGKIPSWLNEGLACYLAGQEKKKVTYTIKDFFRLTNGREFELDKDSYNKSYWMVKNMIKGGGRE